MKKSHDIAVFIGPSLRLREAYTLLNADYFPPARKGDIYRILASGVKTIVLVDGVFHNTPSVWPREILCAVEEGIQVIGAASMGALRAAELHPFGMSGYGTVFEWYRNGAIEGDDEVAVIHASAEFEFRPMSEALVNIRYTLARAVADHFLSSDHAQELLHYAKGLYYPERSYETLMSSPTVSNWPEHDRAMIQEYVLRRQVNLKMLDAIGVLRHVSRMKRASSTVAAAACPSRKDFWQTDRVRLSGFYCMEGTVTGNAVLQEAQKDHVFVASMWKVLSQRAFLLEWATQNDISLTDEFLHEYTSRWEECHGIDKNCDDWLRANGLTYSSFQKLLVERAMTDWIISNGPAHFGMVWDFELAWRQECRLVGRSIEAERSVHAFPAIRPPLLDQEQKGTVRQAWIEFSCRRFIMDWARNNGVSCPSAQLRTYREKWERAQVVRQSSPTPQRSYLPLAEYSELLVEQASVDWITSQGPNHFGLLWAFEDVLLGELQITGKAARLLQDGH